MKPHICTCGDCNPEPFVDACKYEAEVERLRDLLRDVVLDNGVGYLDRKLQNRIAGDASKRPVVNEERAT